MRRTITTILGFAAATWAMGACADVTVMAVRLGAKDVVTLAKFYDTVFGLKEIDRVGQPTTEIIMRYGTSVAAAKAGSSPEFLLTRREPGAASDTMAHAIFHVSDMGATLAAAKTAGATMKGNVASIKIGSMPVKVAQLTDPEGNVLELMELPKGADAIRHP
jgi:predicted enzyme related to lactoylglutathione lyase